ncbi:MAG: hypothetical protein K2X87_19010 [Gemmataceae bacterium]|nr:hypothetical protein [Gemmataceae bacterium]
MPIKTRCPDCRAPITLADAEAGETVTCPGCYATFTAPKRVVAAAHRAGVGGQSGGVNASPLAMVEAGIRRAANG